MIEQLSSRSRAEHLPAAQKLCELEQRQSQNGKVIASDLVKELDPSSLQPIRADRTKNRGPLSHKIPIQKRITEPPHAQLGRTYCMPYAYPVLHDASRGDKVVSAATERLKLSAHLFDVCRFVEPLPRAMQNLIGADDKRVWPTHCYRPCLRVGQRKSAIGGALSAAPELLLDEFLVQACGLLRKLDAGSGEQAAPRRTSRSKNQRLIQPLRAGAPAVS